MPIAPALCSTHLLCTTHGTVQRLPQILCVTGLGPRRTTSLLRMCTESRSQALSEKCVTGYNAQRRGICPSAVFIAPIVPLAVHSNCRHFPREHCSIDSVTWHSPLWYGVTWRLLTHGAHVF